MEEFESPFLLGSLTDVELTRYVYSLLIDPANKTVPKPVVSELLARFERLEQRGKQQETLYSS
jgi:hypothetical protein